jgi:hypothetical protein
MNLRGKGQRLNDKQKLAKAQEIGGMGKQTVTSNLKEQGLPSYGTNQEKRNRLR